MKRIFFVLFASLMLLSCSGCGLIFAAQEAYENFEQDQNVIYVAFSKDGEENDPMDYLEIAEYESAYAKYNSRVMYHTMTAEEQLIYRIFEYAQDHEYTSIFLDSRLLAGVKLSLEEILRLYSMDSPLVQQNYSYSAQESGYTFSYLEDVWKFDIQGSVFHVDNFSHEALAKKKEAIAVAEQVFAAMPPNLSQLEQARYFFRYLTREVTYSVTDYAPGEQNNLYDAFCNKTTQCDGFSNAFSLLCAMAQIPCVEKIVTPAEEGEIGHTWNVFCADGIWYNADLALNEEYAKIHQEFDVDFSFGFSDGRKEEIPDFAEKFPLCTTDLLTVDLMVTSGADETLLKGLKEVFKNKDKTFALIGLEEGELGQEELQKIANTLDSDIRSLSEIWGGKYYYYIFKV
ncbi:MAG: transglutaminase domain-containing protein [Clostridia bacterium]|nr:transglutaminase domain-containing protein [Clostridia bacterium]